MVIRECGCRPAFGDECDWCNGFAADAGITPPAPDLPTEHAWNTAGWLDPWLVPLDHPAPAPF